MFRNILVSFDGSVHAGRALHEAIDLAGATNGRLTILTAVHQPPPWTGTTGATAAAMAATRADLEREAVDAVHQAVDRVPDHIPVTTIVSHEPIRTALMHQIKSCHHDLLVMGSRGRGALSASLLGSVSHFALNHCPIPLLIVHAEGEDEPAAEPARADHALVG